MRNRTSLAGFIALSSLLPSTLAIGVYLWALSTIDELPARLATRFSADNAAGGFITTSPASLALLIFSTPTIALVLSLVFFLAPARRGVPARSLTGLLAGISVLTPGLSLSILSAQKGLTDPSGESIGFLDILWPPLISVLLGLTISLLVQPEPHDADKDLPGSTGDHGRKLNLPNGAASSYFDSIRQSWLTHTLLAFVAIIVVAVSILANHWWVGLITLAIIFTLSMGLNWRLRISHQGLSVRTAWGWPTINLTLNEISSAEVSEISSNGMWLGLGHRTNEYGTGIITRTGKALRITRMNGKIFEVTCSNPEVAAGVVNELIKQR